MDELINAFQSPGGQGDQISTMEVVFAMSLLFACSYAITTVYRLTHKGSNYSQNYVHSLMLLGLVTTLIMVVIGSNIARAFSLVGALSIIRFRNAIKDTRDVAYIFFVMAIAMACGTRFYSLAIVATAFNCSTMAFLHYSNFANITARVERLLTVQFPPDIDPEVAMSETLVELFESFSIVSIESVRQGLMTQVVLSVVPKPNITGLRVIESLSRCNDSRKIVYNYANHTDDL